MIIFQRRWWPLGGRILIRHQTEQAKSILKSLKKESPKMKEILDKLTQGQELSQNELDEVVFGLKENRFSDTQIADFLMAFITKGPTTAEVVAIVNALRRAFGPIKPRFDDGVVNTELNRLMRNQGIPS